MAKSLFFKLARAGVDYVAEELNKKVQAVTELALKPVQLMAQQVVGGTIWRGNGADAFVEAVSKLVVPDTNQMMGHITELNGNIHNAVNVMDQVDVKVSAGFEQLGDVFSKIYGSGGGASASGGAMFDFKSRIAAQNAPPADFGALGAASQMGPQGGPRPPNR